MKPRILGMILFLTAAAHVHAQERAETPPGPTIEADPIRCWLKTTKAAVQVGEQFNLALTCAVVETRRVKVVPELTAIDPATLQLAPFEVLRGTRHPDIRSRLWRYFQFEYTLRLINDGYFGQDVAIPPVTLRYAVHTSEEGVEQQGIERSYMLPTVPVRILSLVPESAKDIRDASGGTFADIERRQFRGTAGVTAALVLFAFAAVLGLLGVARVLKQYRKHEHTAERVPSEASVLTAAIRVLRRAADEAATGSWTPELVSSSLAAVRIGAGVAGGRKVGLVAAEAGTPVREGQIIVPRTVLRRRCFLVSASTTPAAIDEATSDETLLALRTALVTLSEARYARNAEIHPDTIAHAVDSGLETIRRLRRATRWPLRWWRQATKLGSRPVWIR